MLSITLRPNGQTRSIMTAESAELFHFGSAHGTVYDPSYAHRVVQYYHGTPRFMAAMICGEGDPVPDGDIRVDDLLNLDDRFMVDGAEYAIYAEPYSDPALKLLHQVGLTSSDLNEQPHTQSPPARDGAAWRALTQLRQGDKLNVTMDTNIVPAVVTAVHDGGLHTTSAYVMCRLPGGPRIEITHEDLVTGARTFTYGTSPARIRTDVFA